MSAFQLRVYDGRDVRETVGPYPLDAAEPDAEWYVNHDGATKVEIVRQADGEVVKTVPAVIP